MRKRYQRGHTCTMCHPNKMGWAPRWTERDLLRLRAWERERQTWQWYDREDQDDEREGE